MDDAYPPGLGALLIASAALMGSPGPSTISVTAVGAAFGLRRALPYVAGLILGTTAVLLAVATGLFAALAAVPQAAPVLTAAAALYILWLAVRIARAPPLARDDPSVPAPSIAGGLLLATANPKAWIAIGAVFAASRLDGLPPAAEAIAKTLALTAMIVAIHLAWLLVGASLARLLAHPVASRAVNLALAVALVATTAWALLPR